MSDFKQLTAYTNVKCKCVAPTLPPCDLLAKCDWHGDELRVELPQWPEVVTVWVDGKAMPYVPVTNTHVGGTCKVVSKPCDMWECECGKTWWQSGAPSYCPSCGRVAVLATPTDNATLSDLFGIWKEDE